MSETTHTKTPTRRQILKVGATLAVSSVTGFGLGVGINRGFDAISKTPLAKNISTEIKYVALSQQEKNFIDQIQAFRFGLGLEPILLDDVLNRAAKTEWEGTPQPFRNEMNVTSHSYGEEAQRMLEIVYGKNATRIVYGIKHDTQLLAFNGSSRTVLISENHSFKDILDAQDVLAHEMLGHGTDPLSTLGIYPRSMLIRILADRTRMVARAFSISNEYLHHPNDLMIPVLEREVGKTIALALHQNKADLEIDKLGIDAITAILPPFQVKRKDGTIRAVFNKRACRAIGEIAVKGSLEGKIKLKGNAYLAYSKAMEGALTEMYAEMVRMTLLHPEGTDTEIQSAYQDLVSAIRGDDVSLNELRTQIKSLDPAIVKRNYEENIQKQHAVDPQTPVSQLSEEDKKLAKKQEEEYQHRMRRFEDLTFGVISEIADSFSDDQKMSINTFGTLYSTMVNEYPELTSGMLFNESFDPKIDIWDIEAIQSAVDRRFIDNLLDNLSQGKPIDITDLEKRIKVLSDFISSEAFGT